MRCDGRVRVRNELHGLAEGARGSLECLRERVLSGEVMGGRAAVLLLDNAGARQGVVQPLLSLVPGPMLTLTP